MTDDDESTGCPVHSGGHGGDGDDDTISYGSYLNIPELLELQQPESDPPAHDELLFITIHQAYELWFKEILFELESIRELMGEDDVYEASRLVERVIEIEELLVQQIHILETMRPRDFLAFRSALQPASGFQSIQFREVEFLSGVRRPEVLEFVEMDDEEEERLQRRLDEPSLRESFYEMLARLDFEVCPPEDGEFADPEARRSTVEALTEIYSNPRDHFHVYQLAENLVEHDQNILLWRYHHVRVVERLIGTKSGTGGSPGVEYLESTLDQRAYPLLWEVRGELSDEQFYGTDPLADLDF
jgi:tryptophan 2,3-dioxygenase